MVNSGPIFEAKVRLAALQQLKEQINRHQHPGLLSQVISEIDKFTYRSRVFVFLVDVAVLYNSALDCKMVKNALCHIFDVHLNSDDNICLIKYYSSALDYPPRT